ncbi:MAG: di-trans,poly-cis-decaprenylcistransferase [Acidimicrobiia bacterium]|nr:di-trans,poly-cis-decaprenylcistransferase [Acidimicrobiia bacterium]
MDGNGRWANERGLERTAGHAAGEAALFDTALGALDLGLEWLTVFTFSTENWSRSAEEVQFLMLFNEDLLSRRRDELHDRGVRMLFAGDLADPRIPQSNKDHMREAMELTANNTRLNLVFGFNYGGRAEIVNAAAGIAALVAAGEVAPGDIDGDLVAAHLAVPGMPDADLIIRTSGEQRISNFLLWQSAYAEYVFPEILWPDFRRQNLADCIVDYQTRTRRFGRA